MAWDWWPLPMAQPDTCKDTIQYVGEFSTILSSGATTPYLLWANQHGNISKDPMSGNLSLGVIKTATRPSRWFDYDFGVILTGRVQGTNPQAETPYRVSGTGYFRELYAHVRLYIVDITAGIHPVYYGAGEPSLSSGSLLFSNNIHPIPRITIGFDQWTAFPGLFGYVEFKGGLTHGWLADNYEPVTNVKLHHLYIGGRIGGKLPINISYELHHAAQWGGYSARYGDLGNDWNSFWNVVLGRSGGNNPNEQLNMQGNHLLSQILCLTAKGQLWRIDAYWQNIQEDGQLTFIGCTQNKKDGLWGVHVQQSAWPFINGFTYEFIQTTDQSGPFHDRDGMIFGGCDNYYNNSIYTQGWTYFGNIMGSPLLTKTNNRVMAHFFGLQGDVYGFKYRVISTISNNYGTYQRPNFTQNTSILLEVSKIVPQAWGLEFGLSLAGDFGTQFGNQFGAQIAIRKKGIIISY